MAATTPIVAVLDADGSLDPGDLPGAGRRTRPRRRHGDRPPAPGAGLRWPWHARLGTAAVCWRLRTRYGLPVHDIAPMRVARRDALLALGVTDRRSGYPLELLVRAAAGGLAGGRTRRRLRAAHRRQVEGQWLGARQCHCGAGLLAGDLVIRRDACWWSPRRRCPGWPRPGWPRPSATTPPPTSPPPRCWTPSTRWPPRPVQARVVALTGDLDRASRAAEIRSRLGDFTVIEQRGDDFADRLANAHADAAAAAGCPVLQIGMDTPQVTADLIDRCAQALLSTDAVLGHGARRRLVGARASPTPAMADCLRDVPMSRAGHRRCNACRAARHGCRRERWLRSWPTSTPSTTSTPSGARARPTVGSREPPQAAGV